jgi:nicotinate-nucleotide adenylyltransferase
MRVAIYGGSFDPPHVGHVVTAANVAARPDVDMVLVTVCYQQAGKALAAYDRRLEMAKAAFLPLPCVYVTGVERQLGGESLTLRTLRHLAAEHPDWRMRFVVGADVYARGPTWGEAYWAELCALAPPLVVTRVGHGPGEVPAAPEAASSVIRAALARGDDGPAAKLLPRAVYRDAIDLYGPGRGAREAIVDAPPRNQPPAPCAIRL